MAHTTRAIHPAFPVTEKSSRMLQRIVSAAAIAGLISGLLLTGVQQVEVAPLIRIAEAVRKVAYMINVPHAFTPEYTGSPSPGANP